MNNDWKKTIEENMKYDPAEYGSNWEMEDLFDFIQTLLDEQAEDKKGLRIPLSEEWSDRIFIWLGKGDMPEGFAPAFAKDVKKVINKKRNL